MTARNHFHFIALVFALATWKGALYAEEDVTVITTPAPPPSTAKKSIAAEGTQGVHKSLHKKKSKTVDPGSSASTSAVATTAEKKTDPVAIVGTPSQHASSLPAAAATPATVVKTPAIVITPVHAAPGLTATVSPPLSTPISNPATSLPSISPGTSKNSSVFPVSTSANLGTSVPAIETGLPVAKFSGAATPIKGVSTYSPNTIPASVTLQNNKSLTGATTHQPVYANILPAPVVPLASTAAGSFSLPSGVAPSHATPLLSPFTFPTGTRKQTNSYPWRRGIITTMFYIGEGGSSISSTDNIKSAWDENWRTNNRGTDDPNDRNGFASANHASTVNPFYIALPFNDLAFPDKARQWVPRRWHRPKVEGKEVSACKDRWVEIKNSNGRSCFAQWEDVGPLRFDHAEYVFGNELPNTYTRAGLDISPAVAQYLGIDDNRKAITSWRFVDDDDVPPGQWLKYDEQAVIYTALHQMRTSKPSELPIQKATEPIDDQSKDSNRKRVDASKG